MGRMQSIRTRHDASRAHKIHVNSTIYFVRAGEVGGERGGSLIYPSLSIKGVELALPIIESIFPGKLIGEESVNALRVTYCKPGRAAPIEEVPIDL